LEKIFLDVGAGKTDFGLFRGALRPKD